MDGHDRHDLNRREFLGRTARVVGGAAAAGLIADGCATAKRTTILSRSGSKVWIIRDPADTTASAGPVRWAAGQLQQSLAARGISAHVGEQIDQAAPGDTVIVAAGRAGPVAGKILAASGVSLPDAPESLGLIPEKAGGRAILLACGSDVRGLTYALLELADRVDHAEEPLAALGVRRPIVEKPANVIRSVTRLFVSEVEDKPWFYDRSFWQRYLSMLVAQRFNRFSLTFGIGYDFTSGIRDAYFHFAYPFLLTVPGYNVRAAGLPDAERERNLETLRFISEAVAARGLHFQLGLWTHAYLWTNSPKANYTIAGLTPGAHAAYCRDALRTLLQACPAISGLTFRVHGESGVPEASYDFWKTVFDGIAQCGRRVEIDMHAKGMDRQMIDVALATGMPVNVSPKYWAEHMGLPYQQASIRPLEMPPREAKDQGFFAKSSGSRRFLRYGYGDLLAEGRRHGVLYRIWPGTQRLLLWGDPVMAAGYGRASSFCGSSGVEICEPLSFKGRKRSGLPGGRDAYADASLKPAGGDWEKYLYTYRVWGRLLYNPEAEPETWRRFLHKRFGAGAGAAEAALGHASRILPLVTTAHDPSAANNSYWPEIYTNMSIVDATKRHPYGDSPSPKRFGTVSSLDPELFSRVDDFAEELLQGKRTGRYSPLEVAQWLQDLATTAARDLAEAERRVADRRSPEFRGLAVDVAIQSGLGRFFAWKLRAGVLYALYEGSHDPTALRKAVEAYRNARAAWAELAERAKGVYVSDITFGLEAQLRGHWIDRLPAIDEDIADMEKRLGPAKAPQPIPPGVEPKQIERALKEALDLPRRPHLPVRHEPPASFRPGEPVPLEAALGQVQRRARPISIRVHYRHVNQGEVYRVEEMKAEGGLYRLAVPGDYTNSPYPLQYFFELRDARGRAWLHPGFNADLCNQPYFVVRQSKETPVLRL